MRFLLLFVFIWPFTHKKAEHPKQGVIELDPLRSPDLDHPCVMLGDLYEYEGVDGAAGISAESCFDAYSDWKNTPIPIFKEYQI
jgi:hypothetical protein